MNKNESGMMAMDRKDRVIMWTFLILTIVVLIGWWMMVGHINTTVACVVAVAVIVAAIYTFMAGRIYRRRVQRAQTTAKRPAPVPQAVDGVLAHQGKHYDMFNYLQDVSMADTKSPVSPL